MILLTCKAFGGSMNKLADVLLRGLKGTGRVRKIADGGGLYIHVSPTGGKLWRMAYSFDGKQKTLSFGAYPAVSLKEARRRRAEAKDLLAGGVDPGERKKAAKAVAVAAEKERAATFEAVSREWMTTKADTYAAGNIKKKGECLLKYIFMAGYSHQRQRRWDNADMQKMLFRENS
jgi:hypothetical protein